MGNTTTTFSIITSRILVGLIAASVWDRGSHRLKANNTIATHRLWSNLGNQHSGWPDRTKTVVDHKKLSEGSERPFEYFHVFILALIYISNSCETNWILLEIQHTSAKSWFCRSQCFWQPTGRCWCHHDGSSELHRQHCVSYECVHLHAAMQSSPIIHTFIYTRTPFYKHGLTVISAWISNYIHYKLWDEITYPFLNFNGCTDGCAVEV